MELDHQCCGCGAMFPRETLLKDRVFLEIRGPAAGKGWGCTVCGLAPDGAVAVVCAACFDADRQPRMVCSGFPSEPGRVEVRTLFPFHPHAHSEAKHEEYRRWEAMPPAARRARPRGDGRVGKALALKAAPTVIRHQVEKARKHRRSKTICRKSSGETLPPSA